MSRFQALSCGLMLGLLSFAGCGGAKIDPQVAAELRSKYLLAEQPDEEATGVIDLRESIQEPAEVVLIGQIGGVDDPWTRGQASFIVTDPSLGVVVEDESADVAASGDSKAGPKAAKHSHGGPDHDPATCPFCSKRHDPLKTLALVQVVDEQGKVLPYDARQLFELSKDQLVIVRGKAVHDASGQFIVSAKSLYVRR